MSNEKTFHLQFVRRKQKYPTSLAPEPVKQVSMRNVLNNQTKWFSCGPTAEKAQHILMSSHVLHQLYLVHKFLFLLFVCVFLNTETTNSYWFISYRILSGNEFLKKRPNWIRQCNFYWNSVTSIHYVTLSEFAYVTINEMSIYACWLTIWDTKPRCGITYFYTSTWTKRSLLEKQAVIYFMSSKCEKNVWGVISWRWVLLKTSLWTVFNPPGSTVPSQKQSIQLTMQFFHSNNLLLLGLINMGLLIFKVVEAVRQLRFVDLPKCSLT